MSWILSELMEGVEARVDERGLVIATSTPSFPDASDLRLRKPLTRVGWELPELVPILLEKGLAEIDGSDLVVGHNDFLVLEDEGLSTLAEIVPGAPFIVRIDSSGSVGTSQLRLRYQFFEGTQPVEVERLGAFVRRDSVTYRLAPEMFAVLSGIESFRGLSADQKKGREGFEAVAALREAALRSGIELDALLNAERIVVSPVLGLRIAEEPGDRISYLPEIAHIPTEALTREFLALDDIDAVLSVPAADGSRVRVVLDEDTQEALRRMQKVRHVGGREKKEVLRSPQSVFDGVMSAVDLTNLSERVKGVGDFPATVRPVVRVGFFDAWKDQHADDTFQVPPEPAVGLVCHYADGTEGELAFATPGEFLDFGNAVSAARARGAAEVEFRGRSIPVDRELEASLAAITARIKASSEPGTASTKGGKYLLIHTNEEELDFTTPAAGLTATRFELPRSLTASLKAHQRAGFDWLVQNFAGGRSGCLLADDMGLGKTLQVLTFLAWLLENPEATREFRSKDLGPCLIVAPVILLENETWLNDMRRFFTERGAIFGRPLVLRDAELRRLRISQGRDTAVGAPVLDVSGIAAYRLVFTNYETVTNYQHSLARVPWTALVTDEAQEYKTPATKISHALKSMKADFRIASTGTPVETRLLDVWNLFDFLQPGLLSTAKDFTRDFDTPAASAKTPEQVREVLAPLKERLGVQRPNGFVLRRDKSELVGLPRKRESVVAAPLSPRQRQLHKQAISLLRSGSAHPFTALHMLVKVYQHPALLEPDKRLDAHRLLDECPKLGATVEQLKRVQAAGEKCLVFTRSIAMQQILATVFRTVFGRDVGIVNGVAPRRDDTAGARLTRDKIIRRFQEFEGADILILSPDVAGIGLTLVEANHVIHYGRWWNPAKEMQATDRVYRIGQTKDVEVYYPTAVDPEHLFITFDERLDQLLGRRKALAADFLQPLPSEDQLRDELMQEIYEEPVPSPTEITPAGTLLDVAQLSPERLGALTAALEERASSQVTLTPSANNGGINVVARVDDGLRCIHANHAGVGGICDEEMVDRTLAAVGYYRSRLAGSDLGLFRPVLVTTGTFSRRAERAAKSKGVELLDGSTLTRRASSLGLGVLDIERWAAARMDNLAVTFDRISERPPYRDSHP